ncbi:MAG: acyltransferase [Firmicutes bacterium]|nr:acyltransferase [Bacillota bacterium]
MKNKKEKNSTIELWRFILTVAIAIGHLNSFIWRATGEKLIFTGGRFLAFFMFLSGYFLMAHYQSHKKEKTMPSTRAWKYTGRRISALYPALLGGVTFAFLVRNIISKTKLTDYFAIFMDSIFEFLGLSQIGLVGLIEPKTAVFEAIPGVSTLWNGPLWYISALILCGFILYYIVAKSEDFFNFFAVIFIIITYGGVGLTELGWDRSAISVLGFSNGIARVMAGMCLGMLLYYVVEYFQKKKFSETLMLTFSFLHIGLALFIIYIWINGAVWNEFVYGLILLIFTAILLINKDYIAVLYNKSNLCNFLGRLSLYYYANHIVFVFLIAHLFPQMDYHASLIFNILFTTCWSFIMLYIDDYVITPIFRSKKASVK